VQVDPEITFTGLNTQSNDFSEGTLTYFDIKNNVLSVLDTLMYNLYFYQIKQHKKNSEGLALIGLRKLKLAEKASGLYLLRQKGDAMNYVVLILESKKILVFKVELKEEDVVMNKVKTVPFVFEEKNGMDLLIKPTIKKKKTLKRKKLDDANDESDKLLEKYTKLFEMQSAKIASSVILCI
jgi:hypothetical protein